MKSFDDILKEGKNRATGVQANNVQHEWRRKIKAVMEALLELNKFYNDDTESHFTVEPKSCIKCDTVSFIIVTKSIKDSKPVRFSPANWKRARNGKYTCDKCSS